MTEQTTRRRRSAPFETTSRPKKEPPAWLLPVVKLFQREPVSGRIETDAESFSHELDQAWKYGSKDVDAAWDRIRELATRGNAAGAIAALTLYGSQHFSTTPREPVFWVLITFLVGLLAVLFRHFFVAWTAHLERVSHVNAVIDVDDQFRPPPILFVVARLSDWIATIAVLGGGAAGLAVLYLLIPQPAIAPG